MDKIDVSKILRVRTEAGQIFRTLIDVLKEVITSTDFTFLSNEDNGEYPTKKEKDESSSDSDEEDEEEKEEKDEKKTEPKKVKGGIKIMAVDEKKQTMIYIKLDSSNFSDFYVKHKSLTVGLDIKELYKFMKSIDKNSIMTISMNKDERQKIEFSLYNPQKSSTKYYRQKLMETNDDNRKSFRDLDFECSVFMETQEFKKICTEMSQFAEHIEIVCTEKEIVFKCLGDNSDVIYKYKIAENSNVKILWNDKKNNVVQSIYNLKNLVTFGRCVNLCDDIILYLKNSYPLFIQYSVGNLGKMLVGFMTADLNDIKHNHNLNKEIQKLDTKK